MINWRPVTVVGDMSRAVVGISVELGTGGAIVDTAVTVFSIIGGCPAKGVFRGTEVGTVVSWMPVEDGRELAPQAIRKVATNRELAILHRLFVTRPSVSPAWTEWVRSKTFHLSVS